MDVYTNANGPAKYVKCASKCYRGDDDEEEDLFDYLERITDEYNARDELKVSKQ